jgi:lipid-A-disaccharide synthase
MKNQPTSVFIFAGERSGDLHGSHLMQALRQDLPSISFWGVGGPAMRKEGLTTSLHMEDFEVMGLTDVLCSLPKLLKHFFRLRYEILTQKPSAVILIDYPGFNLRLAKALRKKGYRGKIVQYICPSIWAHGQHRIQHMANTLDLLLTILPLELKYFSGTSLDVTYVGNPLREYIQKYPYKEDWMQLMDIPKGNRLLALFPGSRQGEIERNLPFLLEASALLKQDHPDLRFAVSCANPHPIKFAFPLIESLGLVLNKDIFMVPLDYTYELMRDCHGAIAKSGTVTLELALHQCPTLVVYNLTFLNRLFAKYILRLKLPHYALANIVAEELVFPELIEYGFSTENIYRTMIPLLEPTPQRKICIEGCKKIRALLEENRASRTAAKKIVELLDSPRSLSC